MRDDYERLAQHGFLKSDERLELIDGIIYTNPPQSPRHATGIQVLQEILRSVFPDKHQVRTLLPLALGAYSQPAPDVAVVSGSWRDYPDTHPTTAVLIVEVSDSSSFHDRERKGGAYARAGIPEYWLLDVVAERLEVYRSPGEGSYQTRLLLKAGDMVTPLASPGTVITVVDLLP